MQNPSNQPSRVFDETECQQILGDDLKSAVGRILIVSAYATVSGIERWRTHFEKATNRGVSVCVFIQKPRHYDRRHDLTLPAAEDAKLKLVDAAVELLQALNIHVTLRSKMHEKLIIIDNQILWEGSMNVLSWFDTTERNRRFCDRAEVARAIAKHKLLPCGQCVTPTIAEQLIERRLSLGLTQEEVARIAGTNVSVVSVCEAGKPGMRLRALECLCDALRLEVQIVPKHLGQRIRLLLRGSVPKESQIRNSEALPSNHDLPSTISRILKQERSFVGVTQHEIAIMAGVGRKAVSECESGKLSQRVETLECICDALGLEVLTIPKDLGYIARQLV